VDPLSLIVSALVAGAAAAGKDVTSNAIKDAYKGLKKLLTERFHHKGANQAPTSGSTAVDPVAVLEAHEAKPDTWAAPLHDALSATGADRDQEILAAAQALLDQVDPQGSAAGKYRIDLRGAQGVQVGDRGQMTVNINPSASGSN